MKKSIIIFQRIVLILFFVFIHHDSIGQTPPLTIDIPVVPHTYTNDPNPLAGHYSPSACFTSFDANAVITNLPTGDNIVITFPAYVNIIILPLILPLGITMFQSNLAPNLIITIAYKQPIGGFASFTNSVADPLIMNFTVNTCAVFTPIINSPNRVTRTDLFKFSSSNNQFKSVSGTNLRQVNNSASTPTISTPYLLALTMDKPSVDFETLPLSSSSPLLIPSFPISFKSHNDPIERFALDEIVDRYYIIYPKEGVSDYFSLDIKSEDDAEILSIDAVDPFNPTTSSKNIYPNLDPLVANKNLYKIVDGSSFKIVFFNPNSPDFLNDPASNLFSNPLDDPNTIITNTNKVGVAIGTCFPQNFCSSCTSTPNHYNYLFNNKSFGEYNYILIHEKVKIKKVKNCYASTGDVFSKYTLNEYCIENYNLPSGCGKSSEQNLDLICENPAIGIVPTVNYIDYSTPNPTYQTFGSTTQQLTVCNQSILQTHSSHAIDYTYLITNSTNPTSQGIKSDASGTIQLKKINATVNLNYFDFTGSLPVNGIVTLKYGNVDLKASVTGTSGIYNYIIDFEDDLNPLSIAHYNYLQLLTNPNINLGLKGVTNVFNSNLPDLSGGASNPFGYVFLPIGASIGITFPGMHLRPCTTSTPDPNNFVPNLKDCSSIYNLDLSNGIRVNYNTMCEMSGYRTAPLPLPFYDQNQFSARPISIGYITSTLNPADVAAPTAADPNSDITHITVQYHPSRFDHPWNLANELYCPDRRCYAKIEAIIDPLTLPTLGASYTYTTAVVTINNSNPLKIFTVTPTLISGTNTYLIQWGSNVQDPDADNPDVTIDITTQMICGNSAFGFDDFDVKLGESCDATCSDCFITYACTSTRVFRHCFSSCPNDHVTTANLNLERRSFGWASESDYEQSVQQPQNNVSSSLNKNDEAFYPCDIIHVSSHEGTFGRAGAATGDTYLSNFYFDLRYFTSDLPIKASLGTPPLLFSLPAAQGSGFNSGFTFYKITSASTCVPQFNNGTGTPSNSFTVPVNAISVITATATQNAIRLAADPNYILTIAATGSCISTTMTLAEFLSTYSCWVDLDVDLSVNNFCGPIDFLDAKEYKLHPIQGLFSYNTQNKTSNPVGPIVFHPSCDPYCHNFTFYQVKPSFIGESFDGPNIYETTAAVRANQCELIYNLGIKIEGGSAYEDFPGEFRPIIRIPDFVKFTYPDNTINFSRGRVIRSLNYCSNDYPLKSTTIPAPGMTSIEIGQLSTFTPGGCSTLHHGISKSNGADNGATQFFFFFDKNCAAPPPSSFTLTTDLSTTILFGIQNGSNGCVTQFPGISNSLIYNPIDLNNPPNIKDSYHIECKFPSTPYEALSTPTEPIDVSFEFKPEYYPAVSIYKVDAPYSYVYFTSPNATGASFELKDVSGNLIASIQNTTDPSNSVTIFKLDDLNGWKGKKAFKLYASWTGCAILSPITITAHFGVFCPGYVALQMTPLDPNNQYSCDEETKDYLINTSEANISVSKPLPDQITATGCTPFSFSTVVTSNESDLKNGLFTLVVPDGFVLLPSSLSYPGSTNPLTLPTAPFITHNATFKQTKYGWPIDGLIQSLIGIAQPIDVHFNKSSTYKDLTFEFHLKPNGFNPDPIAGNYLFSFSAEGYDYCGSPAENEDPQTFELQYSNPIPLLTINITEPSCNGVVTLAAPPALFSYLWNTGATTRTITATQYGSTAIYSVTATTASPDFCTLTSSASADYPIPLTASILPLNPNTCPGSTIQLDFVGIGTSSCSTCNYVCSTCNYLWNTGAVTPSIISGIGNYSVTISDSYGCSKNASTTITTNTTSSVTIIPQNPTVCQGSTIVLGTSCVGCSYIWSTAATTSTINIGAGTYSVTTTDGNGCVSSSSVNVISNPAINLSVTPTIPVSCSGSLTSLSANVSGGTAPYSYSWNTASAASSINVGAGNYLVTVTDNNSCSKTVSKVVTDGTPIVTLPSLITIDCPTTVLLTAGGSQNTYLWSNGETTASISVLATSTTVFSVIVTSPYNCTLSLNVRVLVTYTNCCVSSFLLTQTNFSLTQTIGTLPILPSSLTPQFYNLNTNVVIPTGQTITIDNTEIIIGSGIQIQVQNGGTLIINASYLHACLGNLWQGIVAEPGSTVIINGSNSDTPNIEDAIIGVDASMSPTNQNTKIIVNQNAIFNANFTSIFLHDGNFEFNSYKGALIEQSLFSCSRNLQHTVSSNGVAYSQTLYQLRLRDAGTINLVSGSSYSNLSAVNYSSCIFRDSKFGIYGVRTNLKVENCSFLKGLNALTNTNGIYLCEGFSGLESNHGDYFAIIGDGSKKQPISNYFYDYEHHIQVHNNYDTQILYNQMENGLNGIVVTNTFSPIFIQGNYIDNYRLLGIRLADNYSSNIIVNYNLINESYQFATTFYPNLESKKGIVVDNGSQMQNKMDISNNYIYNCRFGIHVRYEKSGSINQNWIYYAVPDNEITAINNVVRRGIMLQATQQMNVYNNEIIRTVGTCNDDQMLNNNRFVGLWNGHSDATFTNNYVGNIPISSIIAYDCANSQYGCNTFDGGREGYKLVNANIGDQGDLTHPNYNTWLNWVGTSKINGFLQNPLLGFTWYYELGNPDEDPSPLPYFVFGNFNALGSNNCISYGLAGCTACLPEVLYHLATDSIEGLHSIESEFYNHSYVYQVLKDSLQLMYSGSTHDADLQNFFSLMAMGNVGALNNVDELLGNNDRATAYLQNEAIQSTELVQLNLEKVNRICALIVTDTLEYDSVQRVDLTSIAYQLPSVGGKAVYRARAILGLDIDDTEIAFRKSSENSVTSFLTVIPNPSTGIYNLYADLEPNEILNCKIYNSLGLLIKSFNLDLKENNHRFDLSQYADGTYTLRTSSSLGRNCNNKLVLIKNK